MYQCTFNTLDNFYACDFYDLPTDKEVEIIEIIKKQGFEVSEIWNIRPQT
tara:strand:+ start:435 stop:584 length:150 start_codon:yes stop_codon:yes gene_type:complete